MTGDGIMTDPFHKKRDIAQIHPAFLGVINAFNNSFLIHTGADFKASHYTYTSTTYNPDARQTIGAVYGQAKVPVTSKLAVTAGGRTAQAKMDAHSVNAVHNNHATIGSLMLSYQVNNKLQFYARSAGNYRFPKSDEVAWTYQNKALKTQTGVSYVLGSTWQNEKLNFAINIYQLDLKNEILAVPEVDKVYNENLPRTRHTGLNFNANYLILPKWKINSGYNYTDAKFTAGSERGNQIPFVARNQFYLANYFYLNKSWYVMLDGTYTGSRYPASDTENQGDKLNGFAVFNSAIGYHFRKLEITLRLNNLTDKKYDEYAVYAFGYAGQGTYYYPAPGINGMLNLKIDL